MYVFLLRRDTQILFYPSIQRMIKIEWCLHQVCMSFKRKAYYVTQWIVSLFNIDEQGYNNLSCYTVSDCVLVGKHPSWQQKLKIKENFNVYCEYYTSIYISIKYMYIKAHTIIHIFEIYYISFVVFTIFVLHVIF